MNLKTFAAAALALGLLLPVAARAQENQAQEPTDPGVSDTKPFPRGMRRPRPVRNTNTARKPVQEGCWAKAGISKAEMEQRHAIQQRTRSEIEAVCTNSSLSEQQKREEIHQIQQATQQQLAGMLTSQQKAALETCQRANAHPHAGGPGPHMGAPSPGPCGFLH